MGKTYDRALTQALMIYGAKCGRCGTTELILLEWHHKEGRKKGERRINSTLKPIVEAGEMLFDVELLCANCHKRANIEDGRSTAGIRNFTLCWKHG